MGRLAVVSAMAERHQQPRRTDATDAPPSPPATEDVLIRNYDFQWGYDLEVAVTDADGEPVHDERYYLQPGETKSEFELFGSGEHEVQVVLDNRRTVTARVGIGGATDGVLVELGNGAVSVHDGFYG